MFYRDLFKPLGRLAFLALALEIEDQALKLCQSVPINEQCWFSITDPRKRKALDLFKLRYEREPELKADKGYGISWSLNRLVAGLPQLPDVSLLIGCTTLIDKARMIWKQQLVDANTLKDVLGFFPPVEQNSGSMRTSFQHRRGVASQGAFGSFRQFS